MIHVMGSFSVISDVFLHNQIHTYFKPARVAKQVASPDDLSQTDKEDAIINRPGSVSIRPVNN